MSSLEARAALLPAAQIPLMKGKSSAAGPRRAALGEITNSNAANAKRAGPSKSKPACAQKVKPVQVVVPTVQVGSAEPPPAVPEAPPAVPEEGALCRGFSQVLLAAPDVDEQDADQPQLCSQYVKEIYQYLHVLEEQQAVRADYMRGYEITERMRELLVDWLVQVHSRFQLLPETLYMTVALLDRFLQVQPVSRRKLQLVGVTAMLVACKYEEMFAPEVGDFAYVTDGACSRAQILEMEQQLLRSLSFQLGRPLPLHFLRRASKVAGADVETHSLAKYLMELTLLDYGLVQRRPSEVAAASLCLSQLLLTGTPWSPVQQHYSSYDQQHLQPLMQRMARSLVLLHTGQTRFQAVRNKFSSSRLLRVSLLPQLKSPLLEEMAAPLLAGS
ncbi:G2/mitotic-specific cyclin-B2-like [Menidia menidia]